MINMCYDANTLDELVLTAKKCIHAQYCKTP